MNRSFILDQIHNAKPQLDLGSVYMIVTGDPHVAAMPWRCHYKRNEKFPQHIYVSVEASPEDLVSYFLSDIGRGAVTETQAASRQLDEDKRLNAAVEKVGES